MRNQTGQVPGSISTTISHVVSGEGTIAVPNYYEGPADIHGDVRLHGRYFTYKIAAGLVAGCDFSVMFTIDRPAKDVWPYFKNFNLWQNAYDHYYSGVVGDLEGDTFSLSDKPNDVAQPHYYKVLRVIPEYLIVISQPIPTEGNTGLPGLGGVSPGFHVFLLNEHGGKTIVSGLMEHASRTDGMTDEEALGPWRDEKMLPDWQRKWRDDFIPTLKRLVYEDSHEIGR